MQWVTCYQCGHEITIAPNACLCSYCGEDLQHLLLSETVAEYFQARAHESSERGELGAALAETERGLTYADSSELHLLAAILSKQLGRHDRMRQHVAAIPVDDTLRGEAEWLLRSHQDRERALQEAARHAHTALPMPDPIRPDPTNSFLEELLGVPSDPFAAKRTQGQAIAFVAIVMVAMTMVAASWWWIGPGTLVGNRVFNALLSSADRTEASENRPTPVTTVSQPTATAPLLQVAPTPVLLPTATPTVAVPANFVQVAEETPALVDSDLSHVVPVTSAIIDIQQYLRNKGYAALAELKIDARLQGETLVLQGIVHMDAERRDLLELARSIPGVREVSAVNLLLRPLPTYVVQDGDTLWSIVYNIYGNVERLDEIAVYNRDVLPAPDALAPGIELKVLPIQ